MTVIADQFYHLIYAPLQFARNEQLLRSIQGQYANLEIPYLDTPLLTPEAKQALDHYLYLPVDPAVPKSPPVFRQLCRKYPQVQFTILGELRGKDILKLVANCQQDNRRTLELNAYYRIIFGDLRNLQVLLESVDKSGAHVSFELLGKKHTAVVPYTSLDPIAKPLNPHASFRNLMADHFDRGKKAAVIIDGSYSLHRAMFGNDRLYTKDKRFVGGCSGFYYDLLKMKEQYPEREIHVVFDGYDERKFSENPDYKALRQGGTDRWRAAYEDNLTWCMAITHAFGFYLYTPLDKEGDDVVGSLAHYLTTTAGYQHAYIFSLDTDFYQLVNEKIELEIPKTTHRGHSMKINMERAREKFSYNLVAPTGEVGANGKPVKSTTAIPVNRNDKINWLRALTGDSSDNIISINKFYERFTGEMTKYITAHYMPLVNAADTLDELLAALRADPRFIDFVDQGQFDKNLKLLTINRTLFDDHANLDDYRGTFQEDTALQLLEDVAFFREIEQFSRVQRILNGIW